MLEATHSNTNRKYIHYVEAQKVYQVKLTSNTTTCFANLADAVRYRNHRLTKLFGCNATRMLTSKKPRNTFYGVHNLSGISELKGNRIHDFWMTLKLGAGRKRKKFSCDAFPTPEDAFLFAIKHLHEQNGEIIVTDETKLFVPKQQLEEFLKTHNLSAPIYLYNV